MVADEDALEEGVIVRDAGVPPDDEETEEGDDDDADEEEVVVDVDEVVVEGLSARDPVLMGLL